MNGNDIIESETGKSGEAIGLIGVGLLGSEMAHRLLQSGYAVCGFDPIAELARFADAGGIVCGNEIEVVSKCRRVLFSLPDSKIAQLVSEKISPRASGRTIIDTTTGSPDDTVALARTLRNAGGQYLDATVAGSSVMMRDHVATILVGGDEEVFNASRDLFDALGRNTFYLGGNGSGAKMKLVVNLAIGLNRAVLGEALAFGESFGFDSNQIVDVLINTPAHSDAMDTKGRKMANQEFEPQARLRQHLKDVRLILDSAKNNSANVPITALHEQLLQRLVEEGFGDQDNSVVVQAFRNER